MASTYTGNPNTTDDPGRKDLIRLLVGDTVTTDLVLSDEEIQHFLGARNDNTKLAAADAAEAIAAFYARQADTTIGKLKVNGSSRFEHYTALAKKLRAQATRFAEIFAGGRSIAGKQALKNDTDAVQPFAEIGQDDNPATAQRGRFKNDGSST